MQLLLGAPECLQILALPVRLGLLHQIAEHVAADPYRDAAVRADVHPGQVLGEGQVQPEVDLVVAAQGDVGGKAHALPQHLAEHAAVGAGALVDGLVGSAPI